MRPLSQVCLAVSIATPTPTQNQEPRTETHLHRSSAGSWQTLPPSLGGLVSRPQQTCSWQAGGAAAALPRLVGTVDLVPPVEECQSGGPGEGGLLHEADLPECPSLLQTDTGGTAGFIGFPGPPIVLCTAGQPPQKASINHFFAGLFSPTLWQ